MGDDAQSGGGRVSDHDVSGASDDTAVLAVLPVRASAGRCASGATVGSVVIRVSVDVRDAKWQLGRLAFVLGTSDVAMVDVEGRE